MASETKHLSVQAAFQARIQSNVALQAGQNSTDFISQQFMLHRDTGDLELTRPKTLHMYIGMSMWCLLNASGFKSALSWEPYHFVWITRIWKHWSYDNAFVMIETIIIRICTRLHFARWSSRVLYKARHSHFIGHGTLFSLTVHPFYTSYNYIATEELSTIAQIVSERLSKKVKYWLCLDSRLPNKFWIQLYCTMPSLAQTVTPLSFNYNNLDFFLQYNHCLRHYSSSWTIRSISLCASDQHVALSGAALLSV